MDLEETVVKKEDATEEMLIDPLADADAGFSIFQEKMDAGYHWVENLCCGSGFRGYGNFRQPGSGKKPGSLKSRTSTKIIRK